MQELVSLYHKVKQKCSHAVVFDIDGTLIDIDGEPIKPVCDFFKYLLTKPNVVIYIITARSDCDFGQKYTKMELSKHGLDGYQNISFFNHNNPSIMIPIYKETERRKINIPVVMSLGDNPWDYGKYGGLGVHITK